jgi:hypothetical protein
MIFDEFRNVLFDDQMTRMVLVNEVDAVTFVKVLGIMSVTEQIHLRDERLVHFVLQLDALPFVQE